MISLEVAVSKEGGTVSLWRDKEKLDEQKWERGARAGTDLLLAVEALLTQYELVPQDIEQVVLTTSTQSDYSSKRLARVTSELIALGINGKVEHK